MIVNKENLRRRYLRDPLPIRLGELAVTFARISSSARVLSNPGIVRNALEEAKYFIEWTAGDTESENAAELVSMQRLINRWLRAWKSASQHKEQHILVSVQAKQWSDRVWTFHDWYNNSLEK